MSLNEIYDGVDGHKSWQNYRINDLNIAQHFEINTTGAAAGDILQLDGSLNYAWVPYTAVSTLPLEYTKGVFSTSTLPANTAGTTINVSAVAGSPSFTTSSGRIVVSEVASLLVFLNITSVPTASSMPLFTLVKYSTTGDVVVSRMSPYLTTAGSQYTSANCIAPMQVIAGDQIGVVGYTVDPSNVSCSIITAESNINILRLN